MSDVQTNPIVRLHPDGSKTVEWEQKNRIITIDDLLDVANVDRNKWKIEYDYVNSWETTMKDNNGHPVVCTNHQVKVKLVPNTDFLTMEELVKQYKEEIKEHSPEYRPIHRQPIYDEDEAVMIIMDLFDLHVGMLAWAEETRDESWDSKIVRERAMNALERLITYCSPYPIEKIVFPVGNDLFHVDNKNNETTRGTTQDVDTRYLKMFRRAQKLMIDMVDRLRQIAPVEVVVVPGNHDQERAAYLGETLNAWYRNDPEVVVNNRASLRKYIIYGSNLIGLTHGKHEKMSDLPLIMASEEPEAWGQAKFREWHTGHIHRKSKKVTTTADTYKGVTIHTIPSLCPPDAWAAMKGYVGGGRAAECYIYNRKYGPVGYFSHHIPRKDGELT